jgi:hypothetical protein
MAYSMFMHRGLLQEDLTKVGQGKRGVVDMAFFLLRCPAKPSILWKTFMV